ncbi:MAG: ABC transporter substrate-binding protein [Deltaproteobacteria bacterium]|nr:ABC transporter substrate-binding protein [Deltaproteobacteria bacterium]
MLHKLISRLTILHFVASTAVAEAPIKIGWIGPLSGNSAVLGIDSVPAAQLAIEEINARGGIGGRMIDLLVEDDQHEPTKSVLAFKKVVSEGAVAVLMVTYGGFMAVTSSKNELPAVVINPLDCNEDIAALGDRVFCVATLTESISDIIAKHIIREKRMPVSVVYDEHHPFMLKVAEGLKAHIGTKNVLAEGIDQNSFHDYRSLIQRIKGKNVHAVVFLGHDPMAQGMRVAREMGIPVPFYTVGTITSPGFQKLAGKSADGALVAFWEAPSSGELDSFMKRFSTKVGRLPILQLASIPSYDAMKILLATLSELGGEKKPIDVSSVAASLRGVEQHHGLSGNITIDEDGVTRSIREEIFEFRDGALRKLKN